MNIGKNKRVVLGVTGGIAAYKSPQVVRSLKQRGFEVRVVLSAAATAFITPLTLQAVSGQAVSEHLLDAATEAAMEHIELARWAEKLVVAPATAHFIAKLATGLADDLLTTVALATRATIYLAPAMNQQMWQHPATRHNLRTLESRGVNILGPGYGDQACGEYGPGRMLEAADIAAAIVDTERAALLAGKRVLITAGPTWEALDAVRGLTNRSSGKMADALAQAALEYAAEVCVVSGPVSLQYPAAVRRIDVLSAQQMLDAVMAEIGRTDIFIGAAAVADYRPATVSTHKLKKQAARLQLELVRNPDILAQVAALDKPPFILGFAAETQDMLANARQKQQTKRVNMIAANNVLGADGAFDSEHNAITLITDTQQIELPFGSKYEVALQLLTHVAQQLA